MDLLSLSDPEKRCLHEIVCCSYNKPKETLKLIERHISRNRSFNASRRRFLSDLVYQLIRWRKRIWGDISPRNMDLSRIADSLEEAENLLENPDLGGLCGLSMDKISSRLSYPKWLLDIWVAQMGLESAIFLALAQNREAPVQLRVNTLKTDRKSLQEFLNLEGIENRATPLSPWGIELARRLNLRGSRGQKNAWFEPQDEGSQLCVLKSMAQPGMKVLDACARSGGKTLALAALMENQGSILCCDIDHRPLERLMLRAKHSGVKIAEKQWVAPDDPQPLPNGTNDFDLVFVDAPCSGLGVLRRKPMARWMVTPTFVRSFPQLQLSILNKYARYVRPKGHLIYVTCTINEEENEKNVKRFLSRNSDFNLREDNYFLPHVEQSDGFYCARLQRL